MIIFYIHIFHTPPYTILNRCIISSELFSILFLQERVRLAQSVVLEHQQYLEVVRELTDWLMTAGEELQTWSDTSGDAVSIRKKLSEVRVRRLTLKKRVLCSYYVHFCQDFTRKYTIVSLFGCFDNCVMY